MSLASRVKDCRGYVVAMSNESCYWRNQKHALIFPPAKNWRTTQLHYLFTDGCGGVAHCQACHAHIRLLIFLRVTQQTATFWDVGTHEWGLWPLKFELGRDFCTMHLTAKFHHPTFSRSEVIMLTNKLTNKQADAAENIHLAPLCYAGGYWVGLIQLSRWSLPPVTSTLDKWLTAVLV